MDPKEILEQLLASGKELAEKGRDMAEEKLNLPTDEAGRAATMDGLKKGAAVGGVLALMLGTKAGRRVTGAAVKYGSLAALGTVAFKAYQDWQSNSGDTAVAGEPVGNLTSDAMKTRSEKIIRAMIAASKADGHIDGDEMSNIKKQIEEFGLDDDFARMLQAELDSPLSAKEIASTADTPSTAAEMYLASLLVVDSDNEPERNYLGELAHELGLSDDLTHQIKLAAGSE
jgi:uncharacterized membrane protein YebE (DUF533 family)